MAAGRRREIANELDGRVRWVRRTFLLLPGVGQRPEYDDYVIRHRRLAAQRAPELGFVIPELGHPYPGSSLPAQQLAMHVEATWPERQTALEDALYRATFTELADLADPEVLRRCARAARVPETGVEVALRDPALAARAHEEHREAAAHGITGIPALVVPGHAPMVGAVPAARYREMLAGVIDADVDT
ncbi:MAG: DsbA family protein [Planctomycetota bacterium]